MRENTHPQAAEVMRDGPRTAVVHLCEAPDGELVQSAAGSLWCNRCGQAVHRVEDVDGMVRAVAARQRVKARAEHGGWRIAMPAVIYAPAQRLEWDE